MNQRKLMHVYLSKNLNPYTFQMTPIVVETNLEWAIPYWSNQKQKNPKIFWEIK